DRGAVGQVHTVVPVTDPGGTVTGIRDSPRDRDLLACVRIRIGDGNGVDRQRSFLVGDGDRALPYVVIGQRAFIDLALEVAKRLRVIGSGELLGRRPEVMLRIDRFIIGQHINVVGPVGSSWRSYRGGGGVALPCAQ